jgi:hypothetical protein
LITQYTYITISTEIIQYKKDAPQRYIISIEEFVKTKTLILYCKCFQFAIVYIKKDVALRTTSIKMKWDFKKLKAFILFTYVRVLFIIFNY